RQRLARALMAPVGDAQRAKRLQELTDDKERLEKQLARLLRLTLPPADPSQATPQQLADKLPERTAFIDLLRYTYFEQDPKVKALKGERRTASYVAFVLRRGRPAARVELGHAQPIEAAWAAWRDALTQDQPDREAAAKLRELVWVPL